MKVMVSIELQEGKNAMMMKRYQVRDASAPRDNEYEAFEALGQVFKAHTAVVLRLLEFWFGSGRIVIMDSAFASVNTAIALRRFLLHCIGMVKHCTVGYPMNALKEALDAEVATKEGGSDHMGITKAAVTNYRTREQEDELQTLAAVAYQCDGHRSTVISTVGTTNLAPARKQVEHKLVDVPGHPGEQHVELVETVKPPRPNVIEQFYQNAHQVDNHNQLRQGDLRAEEHWKTMKWWLRVYCFIFAVCMVDAYYAYCYQTHDHDTTFRQFTALVANYLSPVVTEEVTKEQKQEEMMQTLEHAIVEDHHLKPISEHPKYVGKVYDSRHSGPDYRCKVCGDNHARYYCETCSQGEVIFAVHGEHSSHYMCGRKHLLSKIAPMLVAPDEDDEEED